jgi:hypothetical protein
MKRITAALVALALSLSAASAFASCTSHTILGPRGQMLFCTTCCYGSSCNTTCF